MIDEETQAEIDAFIFELREIVASGKTTGDFSDLYTKYPKVKVGIRVAMRYIRRLDDSKRDQN